MKVNRKIKIFLCDMAHNYLGAGPQYHGAIFQV